jgi:AraC family transcriptional activator of pobA
MLRVPSYRLYGESHSKSVFGFFHIEPFSVRNIPNNWRISPHSHPDFDQLSILLKGKCAFRHDGRLHSVGVPSCVFTPSNVVHEFSYEPDARGCVISVSPDFTSGLPSVEGALNAAMLRIAEGRLVRFPSRQVVAVVEGLVALLFASFERPDIRRRDSLRYLFGSLLLELDRIAVQSDSDADHRNSDGNIELYRRFRDLLRSVVGSVGFSNVGRPQPHTLESLADRLSTTPYALNAACRHIGGCSAREMVQREVLEQAARLLLYSSTPVKEIAFVLGYSHASHFARFFRKRRGMTPEQFRSNSHLD